MSCASRLIPQQRSGCSAQHVVCQPPHPAGMKAISPAVAQRPGVGEPRNSPTPKGSKLCQANVSWPVDCAFASSATPPGSASFLHHFRGWRFAYPRLIASTPSESDRATQFVLRYLVRASLPGSCFVSRFVFHYRARVSSMRGGTMFS